MSIMIDFSQLARALRQLGIHWSRHIVFELSDTNVPRTVQGAEFGYRGSEFILLGGLITCWDGTCGKNFLWGDVCCARGFSNGSQLCLTTVPPSHVSSFCRAFLLELMQCDGNFTLQFELRLSALQPLPTILIDNLCSFCPTSPLLDYDLIYSEHVFLKSASRAPAIHSSSAQRFRLHVRLRSGPPSNHASASYLLVLPDSLGSFFLPRFCVHPRLTPNEKGWPTRGQTGTASRPNPRRMRVLFRALFLKLMNCNVDLPLRPQCSFLCPKLDDVWHPQPSNALRLVLVSASPPPAPTLI
ncbi:hypothetical protein B0H13DRAFT_2440924 [Mycena leptocephala]|nr:hypothetical protein B0H13DRAFT_2440924 [Mycena leptocephala]